MSIVEEKSNLRKRLLKTRMSISVKDWTEKSSDLVNRLKKLPEFKSSKTIHCFVSINERNEVNTHEFLKELISGDKEVIIPITNFETGNLEHSKLNSFNELNKNKWGVLEPDILTSFNSEIDLIIVPLLAADMTFNRLGYGKGFYDRFLKESSALRIGLLFDEFILDKIPVEDFDEKLDILITDKRILKRNNADFIS